MTESEFLEVINLHAANAITGYTVYITFLFGYMTAAYLVGRSLSALQITIISLIYIYAASTWGIVSITHAHSFETLVAAQPNFVPSPLWHLPWSFLNGLLTSISLVASLYFMYDMRSGGAESDE